jgi:hypothetical protein
MPASAATTPPLALHDPERFASLLLDRAGRLAPGEAAGFRRALADALFEATPPERRPAVGIALDRAISAAAGFEMRECPAKPSEPRVGPVRRLAGRLRSILFA